MAENSTRDARCGKYKKRLPKKSFEISFPNIVDILGDISTDPRDYSSSSDIDLRSINKKLNNELNSTLRDFEVVFQKLKTFASDLFSKSEEDFTDFMSDQFSQKSFRSNRKSMDRISKEMSQKEIRMDNLLN